MKKTRKAFSFLEVILIAAILGLLVAVFVPAGVAVRKKAREDLIEKQLDKIAEAGIKYNIDMGTSSVTYQTLVDARLIEPLESVAGETYDTLKVDAQGGVLEATTKFGDVVSKAYK